MFGIGLIELLLILGLFMIVIVLPIAAIVAVVWYLRKHHNKNGNVLR